MTNIVDGMDEARFRSGTPKTNNAKKNEKEKNKKIPLVLENLKNGS